MSGLQALWRTCPFDATHKVTKRQFAIHVNTCQQRINVSQENNMDEADEEMIATPKQVESRLKNRIDHKKLMKTLAELKELKKNSKFEVTANNVYDENMNEISDKQYSKEDLKMA